MTVQPEMLPDGLASALDAALELVAAASDDWWLIGSAAMVLHGASDLQVGDVDLLMSAADAERVRQALQLPNLADGASPQFRSEVFLRIDAASAPIEIMGGFEFRTTDGWSRLEPATREPVAWRGAALYVPALDELIRITRAFGRPKDMQRVERLVRLPASAARGAS
jgi:hypothetical protein